MSGSHRSSASLAANQAPPSPFANKLRLANPPGTLLPSIPPPAPLGLPDLDTISLDSSRSKPQPIPHRRSTSPLRGGPTPAFDRSMDPEVEDEEEIPWGSPLGQASSPLSSSPGMNKFASSFATRVNALFADTHHNRPRMSDAEIEAEAERSREASRREAERILTEEAAARRRAEEQALAQRAREKEQQSRIEQQSRMMERAQLGRPVTPTRGMSLSPVASPKRDGKEPESSWWGLAKSKLTPTKEKDLTPAQQIAADARKQEKGKKSIDWPATPGIRSTDPTLLAMAAASRLATSPSNDQPFMSSTLSSSPERAPQPTYSPKPIMPHEQLAREIEAQGGGRANVDFLGTLSHDSTLASTPHRGSLPFANRATPSPAPSPLQPSRAQTNPAQVGLTSAGTPLGGRSPNASPDKSPNVDKDKKLSPVDDKERAMEREKEKDRRTATTITTTTTNDDAPPLYAQFTQAGALDVPLTVLTVARRFEKLEKWTVGHVRALEERMKDVERDRYLVDRDTKSDAVGKDITALKTGIQDLRRTMETLRDAVPPPAPPQPQPQLQHQFMNGPPMTPVRRVQSSDSEAARLRAMSSTSASSYATALSALNGELSNAGGVRTSVISLGSVEADGIDTRPSVAEVVTPMAPRQPLPPAPSTSASTSSFGSPIETSLTSLASPRPSGSREFKPVVPAVAKDFTPPPPLDRATSPPSGGLRTRFPYPTGDYTINGQSVSPLSATAAQFPMPPGNSSSLTISGTAPLSIDKEKQKERDETPMASSLGAPRSQRIEAVSPTPRKRYTVALSGGGGGGGGADETQRPVSLPTQTAIFTTAPSSLASPPSSSGRSRSQSTYSTAPLPPPSPSPAGLRRTVSSSTEGGLAAVFAQTEDWEDVRDKVLTPRLGEPKFVDPLVIRRKGGKEATSKPMPGAGRGKVPISQLVKFFDGDK